ncbi:MAG: DapH/DapD/GlmU-related protein [Clostridia bacterium]
MKDLLIADARKYIGDKSEKSFNRFKLTITHTSYKYTSLLRKAKYYKGKNKFLYLIYRYRLLRTSIKLGYQIGVDANIGGGLYLGHRGMVVVNGKTTLGENVSLANGVTIGQENRGKRKGVPTIGNKVWIGANAVIVGKITIGDDVLIAPNAYVNFDVPSHSVIVGNPARIINRENATEAYL